MFRPRLIWKIFVIGLSPCLTACSSTGVIPVGENSYMISKQTATGFQTAVGIRADVMEEASAYCSKSNKHLVIQEMQSRDGVPGRSYATVSLTFGCYNDYQRIVNELSEIAGKDATIDYDNDTQKGIVSSKARIEDRQRILSFIENICNTKNVAIRSGIHPDQESVYMTMDEEYRNNRYVIEFECLY